MQVCLQLLRCRQAAAMLLDRALRALIEQTGRNLAKPCKAGNSAPGWLACANIISSVVATNSKHFPPRLQQ